MGIDRLRARSVGILSGLEPEAALLVDVMLPTERVVDAIKPLRGSFQRSHCDYTSRALSAVTQFVLSDVANIGISGPEHFNTLRVTEFVVETHSIGPIQGMIRASRSRANKSKKLSSVA